MRGQTKSQLFLVGLIVALALMTSCCSALTTFGKNHGEQLTPECKTDADCANISTTFCLESFFAGNKTRCLCGDYRKPVRDRCDNDKKRVKVPCSSDEECIKGAQCAVGNATTVVGKRCWCMPGYYANEGRDCTAIGEKQGAEKGPSATIDSEAVVRGLLRVLEGLGRAEGRPSSVQLIINNN